MRNRCTDARRDAGRRRDASIAMPRSHGARRPAIVAGRENLSPAARMFFQGRATGKAGGDALGHFDFSGVC